MSERIASYWDRHLAPSEERVPVPPRTDVLIVGAGFMGRWLAYWLARYKPSQSVVVVESDRFGYGASTRNAGFLTCGHITESLEDVRAVGFESVARNFLARRAGVALVRQEFPFLALDACGSVDFDGIDDAKRQLVQQLNAAAGEEVFVEREMTLGGTPRPVHFSRADAGLNPVELMSALAQRCDTARFLFGRRVRSLGAGTAHIDGAQLDYDHAYVCTNAFSRELHAGSRVVPGRGQVIVTSPVVAATDRVLGYLDRGYDYFRFVDGRLLLGGGRQLDAAAEQTTEFGTTDRVGEHLRAVARRIIGHDQWQVEHHWSGIMGFLDGQHVGGSPRGRIDDRTEVVAGFGGMGVALTPTVARDVVREL